MYNITTDKNNSGIYCIRNIINDKVYVGRTFNFLKRQEQHYYLLDNNKHYNIHLQNSYKKYGKNSFVFEILEVVNEVSKIIEREIAWINHYYKQGLIYNIDLTRNVIPINSKTILQIDKDTNEVIEIWNSLTNASNTLNICKNSISKVCRGQLKTAGGYKWQFLYEPKPEYKPVKNVVRKKTKTRLMTAKDDILDFI